MSGRRILAVWFPRLATDRLAREQKRLVCPRGAGSGPAGPRVTVVRERSALRLGAVDTVAEARGLAVGQSLAEARAFVPDLSPAPHDTVADAALLDRIARAVDRYTPLVGLSGTDGLFLDISGCAHLFGGEAALRADMLNRLGRSGLSARAAIAGTPGAAWAVARYGEANVIEPGGERVALTAFPVAALRLDGETAALLTRLGLESVGDLLAAPRAPLVRRFDPGLVQRIDQALGDEDEPISPRFPPPHVVAERRFAEPLFQIEALSATLEALAGTLGRMFAQHLEGGRRFALALFHADGTVHRAEFGTSRPVTDADAITGLIEPQLEALSARFETDSGIDLVRLAALETAPALPRQTAFDRGEADADVARLIDSLSARLGPDAVLRAEPVDSHQPEATVRLAPALHTAAAVWPIAARPPCDPPERPLRLFERPEPVEAITAVPDGPPMRFRWRKVVYDVAVAEGPERIAPEWWHGREPLPTRDYFRIEDTDGRRFWLFRQGLYGRETGTPGWYVHGLFG